MTVPDRPLTLIVRLRSPPTGFAGSSARDELTAIGT
jgi:hypothetical protein